MKKVVNVYKDIGKTPLEAVEKFREKYNYYRNKKIGYAGRLDPMAEGVLILLIEDENKKIKKYLGFSKEYKAEFIFGFSTDSHDILGIPKKGCGLNIDIKELKKIVNSFVGAFEQKIPKFSSYKVNGKPMFYYARKGIELEEIKKKVLIKKIRINSLYKISNNNLYNYIYIKINKLKGDFIQKDILDKWKELLKEKNSYYVLSVNLECSSGTYIRAIAEELGAKIGCGALLLSLRRNRVGKFLVKDSIINLW